MQFSDRIGVTKPRDLIQVDSMDDDLRISLWNVLTAVYWEKFDRPMHDGSGYSGRMDYTSSSVFAGLFNHLWLSYFKKPYDKMPSLFYEENGALAYLRKHFFSADWYQIYNFIEFVYEHGPKQFRDKFASHSNAMLERERSAYRFVDGKIINVTSKEEIAEIEKALRSTPYYGVKEHLQRAVSHFSNKENPDFRNSIKESISAVESLCIEITGNEKATLGDTLKKMNANGELHPALQKSFSALYGYTSDSNGIRHALLQESNLASDDAKYMLVSCSAFINYLISKREKAI